jgi:adenylate kinase
MIILLTGPQGSGKGTIGNLLAEYLNLPLIGAGKILRSLSEDHPKYEEVKIAVLKGYLAPQEIVAEILKERVSQEDCKNGYILDGWGREKRDLEFFNPPIDHVIVLEIPTEVSINRVLGRRICDSNGKTYNIFTQTPDKLKECTGKLLKRSDDKSESTVLKRLELYRLTTIPTIEAYKDFTKVSYIDATGTVNEVCEKVKEVINS